MKTTSLMTALYGAFIATTAWSIVSLSPSRSTRDMEKVMIFEEPVRTIERVDKPWGWYETLHRGSDFTVKLLYIKEGHRISLQKHDQRSEMWTCVKGNPKIEVGNITRFMKPQDSIVVPLGSKHRIQAIDGDVVISEVWYGKTCHEKDIERFEDDYGRSL